MLANTHASEFVDGVKEQGNLVWPQLTGRPESISRIRFPVRKDFYNGFVTEITLRRHATTRFQEGDLSNEAIVKVLPDWEAYARD
jgi:hypothetical protein